MLTSVELRCFYFNRRKAALQYSEWPEYDQVKMKPAMVPEAMSPEISEDEEHPGPETEYSDIEDAPQEEPQKKIVVRPLSWRSDRLMNMLYSLDRKWLRRCTPQSRRMQKKRHAGAVLSQEAPEAMPNWMLR